MVDSGAQDDVCNWTVDTEIYGLPALFRACYLFTDRCYLFLARTAPTQITVTFRKRAPTTNLQDVIGAFANELINQALRLRLSEETQVIRELIVKQAFAEADFGGPDANSPSG